MMRNFIRTVAVLALLGNRAAIAQTMEKARSPVANPVEPAPLRLTQDARPSGSAPVGHLQPQARDVPLQNPGDLERLSEEDAAIDRKLNICRGC
jgi:hypothetical protein